MELIKQFSSSFKYITHQPLLKSELYIIHKLLYKNKNQHQATDYYQKLKGLAKHYQKYNQLEIDQCLTDILKAMRSIKGCTWERIPNKNFINQVCKKLLQAHILLSNALIKSKECFIAFQHQVQMTYFMPLSLVCMGCISRIHHLTIKLMENIKNVYQLLWKTCQQLVDSSCDLSLPSCILPLQEYLEWDFTSESNITVVDDVMCMEEEEEESKEETICNSNLSMQFFQQSEPIQETSKSIQYASKSIDKIERKDKTVKKIKTKDKSKDKGKTKSIDDIFKSLF